ncbi:MAG: hypothetical protein ACR2PI_10425 [Hyphomicrobiaceae bacterium]
MIGTDGLERSWWCLWLVLLAHALMFVAFGWMFEHHRLLVHSPILTFAAGLISAGTIALLLPALVRTSTDAPGEQQLRLLFGIVAGGLLLRLLMFWTPPALESDFYRYLWDGALTATGHNPYAYAPAKLDLAQVPQSVRDLAFEAGYVHERINHAELRTIYPPVAQAFFALAYRAETWSLTSWRLICLLCELATLGLLYRLLLQLGRSPLWLVLYWWNPLLIKELANSVHMEAVLLPFLAGAAFLAASHRPIAACIALALAAGVKVWPILIVPLLLRDLWSKPRALAVAIVVVSAIVLACAAPPLLAGIDENSGFAVYATSWYRNGGLIVLLQGLLAPGLGGEWANLVARGLVAVAAGTTAVALAWQPIASRLDLVRRMMLVALVALLLSPAQFPWYAAWVMPFMVVAPLYGVLVMTALMPLYYTRFYFQLIDQSWIYQDILVFTIWLPVWTILAVEWRRSAAGRATLDDRRDDRVH